MCLIRASAHGCLSSLVIKFITQLKKKMSPHTAQTRFLLRKVHFVRLSASTAKKETETATVVRGQLSPLCSLAPALGISMDGGTD